MPVKIAAATEDGQRVSSHFGMAPLYKVFSVEDDRVLGEEQREKPHHSHHPGEHHDGHHHGQLHEDMFAPISDCQVLLVGGMGQPAFEKARQAGLQVVLTGGSIEDVLQAYLRGDINSDMRRIHHH